MPAHLKIMGKAPADKRFWEPNCIYSSYFKTEASLILHFYKLFNLLIELLREICMKGLSFWEWWIINERFYRIIERKMELGERLAHFPTPLGYFSIPLPPTYQSKLLQAEHTCRSALLLRGQEFKKDVLRELIFHPVLRTSIFEGLYTRNKRNSLTSP